MKMFNFGMKKLLTAVTATAAGVAALSAGAVTINGAGASFPAPVYKVWIYNYRQATGTVINYQSVGSGAGIAQIKAGTVNFGASDSPLQAKELDKFGLIQFPMLMGGVVPVVNVPGIGNDQLKLSGAVLADIFLGKINNWNDPQIAALNPDVRLPDMAITVVHRSDGSGTSWIFTDYLSRVSSAWKEGPGRGKAVKWPVGIGGQKNPGVAINVRKVRGSIGYVEYTYAVEAKLAMVQLQNKAGNFVKPELDAFQAAGANADWNNAPGLYMVLNDQPGAKSWPITGVTYILIHKNQDNPDITAAMMAYFAWCYKSGAAAARKMDYVPMPENVVALVRELWEKVGK
ncbi:MAG: phosphate ABC transporter substrate-binding protein PstS [Victivallales bacterium]|nr:phosphate ABC transporter substrate-binding protein PstS [Victivallales bacterium]